MNNRANNANPRVGVLAAAVVAMALASCSADVARSEPTERPTLAMTPSPAATPTETPTPTPEPTPDIEALGEQYLAIVLASNAVACDFNDALSNAPSDLALQQDRATALAEAERVAADALRSIDFPPDLQLLIDEQIANRATMEAALLAFAAAADWAAANEQFLRVVEASEAGSSGSNLIRGELGLPSIVVDPCG